MKIYLSICVILFSSVAFSHDKSKHHQSDDDAIIYERDMSQKEPEMCYSDFAEFLGSVRMVPVDADGKINGYQIYDLPSGHIFEKMGLRNKDVILSLNNIKANDAKLAGLAMVGSLHKDKEHIFVIRRNSEILTIKKRCPK